MDPTKLYSRSWCLSEGDGGYLAKRQVINLGGYPSCARFLEDEAPETADNSIKTGESFDEDLHRKWSASGYGPGISALLPDLSPLWSWAFSSDTSEKRFVRNMKRYSQGLPPAERKIIDRAAEKGAITKELAEHFRLGARASQSRLFQLTQNPVLKRTTADLMVLPIVLADIVNGPSLQSIGVPYLVYSISDTFQNRGIWFSNPADRGRFSELSSVDRLKEVLNLTQAYVDKSANEMTLDLPSSEDPGELVKYLLSSSFHEQWTLKYRLPLDWIEDSLNLLNQSIGAVDHTTFNATFKWGVHQLDFSALRKKLAELQKIRSIMEQNHLAFLKAVDALSDEDAEWLRSNLLSIGSEPRKRFLNVVFRQHGDSLPKDPDVHFLDIVPFHEFYTGFLAKVVLDPNHFFTAEPTEEEIRRLQRRPYNPIKIQELAIPKEQVVVHGERMPKIQLPGISLPEDFCAGRSGYQQYGNFAVQCRQNSAEALPWNPEKDSDAQHNLVRRSGQKNGTASFDNQNVLPGGANDRLVPGTREGREDAWDREGDPTDYAFRDEDRPLSPHHEAMESYHGKHSTSPDDPHTYTDFRQEVHLPPSTWRLLLALYEKQKEAEPAITLGFYHAWRDSLTTGMGTRPTFVFQDWAVDRKIKTIRLAELSTRLQKLCGAGPLLHYFDRLEVKGIDKDCFAQALHRLTPTHEQENSSVDPEWPAIYHDFPFLKEAYLRLMKEALVHYELASEYEFLEQMIEELRPPAVITSKDRSHTGHRLMSDSNRTLVIDRIGRPQTSISRVQMHSQSDAILAISDRADSNLAESFISNFDGLFTDDSGENEQDSLTIDFAAEWIFHKHGLAKTHWIDRLDPFR